MVDRTALVTGATAGIGEAFCRALARQGWRLVAVARDEARLVERRAIWLSLGAPEVEVLSADLATPAGRARVAERCAAQQDPVGLLVNNAGFAVGSAFDVAPLQDLQDQLAVNVTAVMELTHAVLPGMKARGFGGVINVASVAGMIPGRGSTYSASKAWVIAFSEGLAVSLQGTGVRTLALCPGFIRTEFHQRAGIDMSTKKSWMYYDVDRLVGEALDGIRQNAVIHVAGGLQKAITTAARLLPRGLIRSAANKVDSTPRT